MPRLPALLILTVSVSLPASVAAQAGDPARAAYVAARQYESLLRRRAPYTFGSVGGRCDEVIGRFCFRFTDDAASDPPAPTEHPDVEAARRRAVEAHRRWLSRAPDDPRAAGGLIRYLIEDDRAPEAVSVARAHAWTAPGPRSSLLLGLALHYTGDFVASEAAFDRARAAASPATRAKWDDVRVLLEPTERARYKDLTAGERRAYNRRFWALSDPSLRVPGNERRSAHYARRAWATILADAPRAAGMLAWGEDHEEIVVRYGLPRSRERIRPSTYRIGPENSLVEYYDPHAVSFVPSALLTDGVPTVPSPGEESELERDTVRSSYAPVIHHRVWGLTGQFTRIPTADGWILRVDAFLPPDTTSPTTPVAARGLLTVMDTLGRERARREAAVTTGPDSGTWVTSEAPVASGPNVVQVEVIDDPTGRAGRGRYRVDVPAPAVGVVVSDPLIARPPSRDTAAPTRRAHVVPFPTLSFSPQPVLIYAEVRGLGRVAGAARYAVEWWLEPAEERSAVARALRWLGRRLGWVEDEEAARVRWETASEGDDPVALVFTVDLEGADPGLYRLHLRVRDRVSGQEALSYRLVRLAAEAPPGARPAPH